MPFKECSLLDQREEFCRLGLLPGTNIRELCRRWGVSSTAAYKWLKRYRLEGAAGLSDRARRPKSSPRRTSPAAEAQVLAVRADHPAWGGRKIRKVLEEDGIADPPAASTITGILRRHDCLNGPRAGQARDWTRFEHAAPSGSISSPSSACPSVAPFIETTENDNAIPWNRLAAPENGTFRSPQPSSARGWGGSAPRRALQH